MNLESEKDISGSRRLDCHICWAEKFKNVCSTWQDLSRSIKHDWSIKQK